MKPKIAYALVNNGVKRGLRLFDSRLPIYWNKKVADRDCVIYGGRVVEVKIEEVDISR